MSKKENKVKSLTELMDGKTPIAFVDKSEYDILPKWMPAEQRLRPRKAVTHE